MNLDRGPGSVVADQVHDVASLGKGFARREPAAGGGEARRGKAAQAKATTREQVSACAGHRILLHQSLSCRCLDGLAWARLQSKQRVASFTSEKFKRCP